MNINFIRSNEKRKIVDNINEQFGISEINELLLETGKEKIRAFSGHLSKEEILELSKLTNIEFIGLYILRQEHDLRLSFDATQLYQENITKNIIEINEDQFKLWIRGNDLPIKVQKGTVIINYDGDFIGCGKSNGEVIFNHVPKERRLRK